MPGVLPLAPFPITLADSNTMSAFGRLNVNDSQSIFSNSQQYGNDATEWETAVVGTGTTTFLPNESTIQMSTGGTANSASCIRSTRLNHRYTPGHGLTTIQSFVFDGGAATTNNTRRIGYFDTNNGIYLEDASGTINIVQRSFVSGSVVNTAVAQAAWNVDVFDGTHSASNPSGILINWAEAQILIIDLQWLGVGRVRVGFDIGGVFYPAHQFLNANTTKTAVYMTTANLPLRLENTNTGTAGGTYTLRHICSSVNTDGGTETLYGKLASANNNAVGAGGLSIAAATTKPLVSIQAATTGPNSVRNSGQTILQSYLVLNSGSNQIYWQLLLNATLTGASFAAAGNITNVDTSATAVSGGTLLDSGFLSSSALNKGVVNQQAVDVKQMILVYSSLLSHQDTLTLVATTVGGLGVAWGGMTWLEEY